MAVWVLAVPPGPPATSPPAMPPAVRAARQAARLTLQRAPRAEKLRPRREAGEIPPASAPLPAAEPEPEPELAVEVEADRAEPAERPSSSRRSGSVPRSEASVAQDAVHRHPMSDPNGLVHAFHVDHSA